MGSVRQGSKGTHRKKRSCIMTSSNGDIFLVTGPLCGEFTNERWHRPVARSIGRFVWCATEQTVKQTAEIPAIWDAMAIIVTSLYWELNMCLYPLGSHKANGRKYFKIFLLQEYSNFEIDCLRRIQLHPVRSPLMVFPIAWFYTILLSTDIVHEGVDMLCPAILFVFARYVIITLACITTISEGV